jgi:predicted dehydrogenase
MSGSEVKVGIVGCGNISGIYCQNAHELEILKLIACADLIPERAHAKAEEFSIPNACTTDEMLADPEVEVVVNLTIPKAHAEVALAAIVAGKHVYSEKPLGVTREEGRRILDAAHNKEVLVGCAPDTFLGAGIQTCRKLVDDGWIGEPIGAAASLMLHGHESWHPDPEFFYQPGGGPMLDMGPYYLTALVNIMGPVTRAAGATRITFPERTITSQAKYGEKITVEVPTHVIGVLEFATGALGTIVTSFDVWAHELPRIEIYGTEGTLSMPDPNTFGGPVRIWRNGSWSEVPLTHGYPKNSRGLGIADMAYALRSGRKARASGELAYHVLDVMQTLHEAASEGKYLEVASTCERPAPLPMDMREGTLDE